MIINYFNQEELDTNDIKEKLDLIATSSTENAKYLSKMLIKTLSYLSQKEELNAQHLKEGFPTSISDVDAVVYFSNAPEEALKNAKKCITIGNFKTNLQDAKNLLINVKHTRVLKKNLKNSRCVMIGFQPEDMDFMNYYYTRLKVYFYNVCKELTRMPYEVIKQDIEKACTTLLLEKNCFQLPFPKDKTKIKLKRFLKAYQTIIESVKEFKIGSEYLFYKSIKKDEYYTNMLNEISLIVEIFTLPDHIEQVSRIYDISCERMLKEAHALGYCDFENNRCIASRYTNGFPNSLENGCCQNTYKDRGKNCRYLNKDHSCQICAISCRMFTCGYLQKRGIDHALFQYPLIDIAFGKLKRTEIIYDFFTPKEVMMKKLK